MEIAKLILEYLKVLLSAPVMVAAVAVYFLCQFKQPITALIGRVAKISLGGAEVTTTQVELLAAASSLQGESPLSPPATSPTDSEAPASEKTNHAEAGATNVALEAAIVAERRNSALWEYRYLNLFFVRHTQVILDWLISLPEPIAVRLYDSLLLSTIPSAKERAAILNVLQGHHLIDVDNATGLITVTHKGREYQSWRGPLPPLPISITPEAAQHRITGHPPDVKVQEKGDEASQ